MHQPRYLDRHERIHLEQRRLPHWTQPGCWYFVTFRTADSLPAGVLRQLAAEHEAWLQRRSLGGAQPRTAAASRPATERNTADARRAFERIWQRYLDAGHGSCLLRSPRYRGVVCESLRHFDGKRYLLDAFVVMPNHVHAIVGTLPGSPLRTCCRNWKGFTAKRINRLRGATGPVWQADSYDRLLRGPEELARLRDYIDLNPRRAGLSASEYSLYQRDEPVPT